jgi:LysM repeat protein
MLTWLVFVIIVGMLMPWHTNPVQASSPSAGSGPASYIVKKGDTVSSIAQRFGVTVKAIMDANGLRKANRIYVGQKLRIPTKASPATSTPAAPVSKMPTATPTPSILPTGRPND